MTPEERERIRATLPDLIVTFREPKRKPWWRRKRQTQNPYAMPTQDEIGKGGKG
jgi:hypothetical protein